MTRNEWKTWKVPKKQWSNFTLRNDPLKVLAMGVDAGAKNRSKEGLIFKIPFAKLKNVKKQWKKAKSWKSSKIQKTVKTWKTQKHEKWQKW